MERRRAAAAGGGGIDALPDELLHHILGFLEAHEAVRTCVLARRWRHLWRHATGLRVVAGRRPFLVSVQATMEFLGYLIPRCEGSPLHMCELRFNVMGTDEYSRLMQLVNTWFLHAITHKVRDLRLRGYFACFWIKLDDMPVNSQHLTRLEPAGLKASGSFLNFSNCPVLEYLEFEDCLLGYDISSESLKYLIINDCTISGFIHICAPTLVSIRISGNEGDPSVLMSMPSLVEA